MKITAMFGSKNNTFYKSKTDLDNLYYDMDVLLRIKRRSEYDKMKYKRAFNFFRTFPHKFDGATFVKERSKSLFEVAAFIHDWRNAMGYVSYEVDREMLYIMIKLDYSIDLIAWRGILTRFTFLNIIRHKLMRTYVGSKPEDLYILPIH